jgi:hypothetical protein
MDKFDSSSKCLTYDFIGDAGSEMFVEQRSTSTNLAWPFFDDKVVNKGHLAVPKSTDPANMIVSFPFSELLFN